MSWYRTYRPQTIGELNLPSVSETLERIRKSGSFSHAYLFTGPKGIGKTSSARILAKMLNCEKNVGQVQAFLKQKSSPKGAPAVKSFVEPCGLCANCKKIVEGSSFNVVEMDAASNRGIDDIRSLRERVNLAPTDGPVTVYIIDEVHMLTTEAFNALLKVLEEPPAHVVFILATTESQKIPETISSRCTVIQYRKASIENITEALERIAKNEGIKVEKGVFSDIAHKADGSFRDAVKFFEQQAVGKKSLTVEDLQKDDVGKSFVSDLIHLLNKKDVQKIISAFRSFEQSDTDMVYVQKEVLKQLHVLFLEAISQKNTEVAKNYAAMLSHLHVPLDPLLPVPHLPFELKCVSWCLGEKKSVEPEKQSIPPQPQTTNINAKKAGIDAENADAKNTEKAEKNEPEKREQHKPIEKKSSVQGEESVSAVDTTPAEGIEMLDLDMLLKHWSEILKEVKPTNATVEALLRAARPSQSEKHTVTIEVFYPFHKEQLEQDKHRRLLEQVIGRVCHLPKVRLMFVLGKKVAKPVSEPEKHKDDEVLVKAAEEVFS